MEAIEQYFPVIFSISLNRVVVAFESVKTTEVQTVEQCMLLAPTYFVGEGLGPVVQKPDNANLGLKVNHGFCFSC